MTDEDLDLRIAEAAPVDEQGHPIHPERGHRICGATKSDRTTPTEHGRERDDYEYCLLAAGWGVDDASEGTCKHHLGAVDLRGKNNPNYEHGAFSTHFRSTFTEAEEEFSDDLTDMLGDDSGRDYAARRSAAVAMVQYKRSADPRFLREFRQICKTFRLTPDERIEVEHSGSVDVEHDVPEHVVEAVIGASESNLEAGDGA